MVPWALAPMRLPMCSIICARARCVGLESPSPVPLRPATMPIPCRMFSSCPFTRQASPMRKSARAADDAKIAKPQASVTTISVGRINVRFLALEHFERIPSPLQPAALVAVLDRAQFFLLDVELRDVLAEHDVAWPDRVLGGNAAERVEPGFLIHGDLVMGLQHHVAVG